MSFFGRIGKDTAAILQLLPRTSEVKGRTKQDGKLREKHVIRTGEISKVIITCVR